MVRALLGEVGEGRWGSDLLLSNWVVLTIRNLQDLKKTITPLERLIFPMPKGQPALDLPARPPYGWMVGHKASFLSWALGEVKLDAFYAVFLTGPDPEEPEPVSYEPTGFTVHHARGREVTSRLNEVDLRRAFRVARRAGPIVVEEILE
jgi:hypothetical protein